MFRKLFLVFLTLPVLTLAAFAIAFPAKDEHVFTKDCKDPTGLLVDNYHKRYWKLLPPADWRIYTYVVCRGHGIRQIGFIGIIEDHGVRRVRKADKSKERTDSEVRPS